MSHQTMSLDTGYTDYYTYEERLCDEYFRHYFYWQIRVCGKVRVQRVDFWSFVCGKAGGIDEILIKTPL